MSLEQAVQNAKVQVKRLSIFQNLITCKSNKNYNTAIFKRLNLSKKRLFGFIFKLYVVMVCVRILQKSKMQYKNIACKNQDLHLCSERVA